MITARPLTHWLALAFLVVAWGSSFALTKIAVQSVAPIWMPAARILIAAVILMIALRARGGALPRGLRNWAWLLWLGATGTILPFYLISWASLPSLIRIPVTIIANPVQSPASRYSAMTATPIRAAKTGTR